MPYQTPICFDSAGSTCVRVHYHLQAGLQNAGQVGQLAAEVLINIDYDHFGSISGASACWRQEALAARGVAVARARSQGQGRFLPAPLPARCTLAGV